jgi:hypothetical protein
MHLPKRTRIALLTVGLASALGSAPAPVSVSDYSVIDLTTSDHKISRAFAVSGDQVGGYGKANADGIEQALLWTGTPPHVVNLDPEKLGIVWSWIRGVSHNRQVGWGRGIVTDDTWHALLWFGTPRSMVDLNPVGFASSQAYGVYGNQEIGQGRPVTGGVHALLWTDTPQSAVDLNPYWSSGSYGYSTDGTYQVGAAAINNNYHAVLWRGTAGSVVDLNPAGFSSSQAYGLSGNQQAGFGTPAGSPNHALLWSGSANSAVDLNPAGFSTTLAMSTNGTQQVGFGSPSGSNHHHALVWTGTPTSCVDLQQFLPPGSIGSMAVSIDAKGDIAGWEIFGLDSYHAVEWIPKRASGSTQGK